MDWNVQWDTRAAEIIAATGHLTLATLPVTLKAHLRAADTPRLHGSRRLGELLADLSKACGRGFGDGQPGPCSCRPTG